MNREEQNPEQPEHRISDPLKKIAGNRAFRFTIVSILLLLFMIIAVFFHLVLSKSVAFSHFAYIPIILIAVWWGRKAIPVALLLGIELLFLHLITPSSGELWSTIIRASFFLIVAIVAGELSRKIMSVQKELSKANTSLKRLSRLHRDFLHIAIHDLKSPIAASTALLHGLETLISAYRTTREKHLIERAITRMDEATSFLREFQFFATLDSSQLRQQATRIDISIILKKIVEENTDLANKRHHTISTEISEDLPQVVGIGRLINEVVANLVTNAIKYTPEGGHIILRGFRKKGAVRVEVEDNGIGIAPEDQEILFQEFVRVRRKSKSGKKVPGIGLGLSIVSRIIEMHNGTIFLESELDKGSTFGFELPVCPPGDGPVSLPELFISG